LKANQIYSSAVKLNIVYNMGLIDDLLYKNLVKLNSLRNKYAHNLGYVVTESDLSFDLGLDGLRKARDVNDAMLIIFTVYKTLYDQCTETLNISTVTTN
jgi:DNA-binding MltR family transcriptional regulator